MSHTHRFPQKDKDFNDYIVLAIAYLLANALLLGVSADNQTLITSLLASWNENWKLFLDPSQHTKDVTDTKTDLRSKLEAALRSIYADIPQSALTIPARNTLNLQVRDTTLTTVAVMEVAPTMATESTSHLLHILRFQNPETPESKAMPDGQKIILESFAGDPGLADAAIDFGDEMNVTTFRTKVTFTDDQEGQTCYYRSCYETTNGERGPWSPTLKVLVG